jgi:uncharacterized protein YbjT (DUF2867 family)
LKLLITGGTGTLGRHFVRQAAAAGHDVRVLTRRAEAARDHVRGDLGSGDGLDVATTGVDTVVHLASNPRQANAVDVDGTLHLLAAATRAGVGHFIYISIVGVDAIPYSYYLRKLEAERLVQSSGLPYSIVRATQFHSLIDRLLTSLARVPFVMPLPAGFQFQSVAEAEVAGRLLRCVQEGPLNRPTSFGGPQVMRLEAMAYAWRAVRKRLKPAVGVPVPGRVADGFRRGMNTAPGGERGRTRWSEWLETHSP